MQSADVAALRSENDALRAELDDFRQSSKELEEELERELDRTAKELESTKARFDTARSEADDWKAGRPRDAQRQRSDAGFRYSALGLESTRRPSYH